MAQENGGGKQSQIRIPPLAFLLLVASLSFISAFPATAQVVVESVGSGSALESAGLEAGDLITAWRRGDEGGPIDSVFDWRWLDIEQAPRGGVALEVRRAGDRLLLTVAAGPWAAEIAPHLPAASRRSLEEGRRRLERGATPEDAVAPWLALRSEHSGDPLLTSWLSLQIADAWLAAGQLPAAETSWATALEAAVDPRIRVAVLDVIAAGRRRHRDLEGSEAALLKALTLRQATWRDSLQLAHGLFQLGSLAWYQGQLHLAEDYGRRSLILRRRLAPGSSVVARTLNGMSLVARERGDLQTAREDLREGLDIWRRLAPGSLALSDGLNNFGVVAWDLHDLEAAFENISEALEIRRRLAPGSLSEAGSINNLGLVALERGDLSTARELQLQALEILEQVAPESLDVSDVLGNLATIAQREGSPGATAYYERSLEIRRKLAPQSLREAQSLYDLATLAYVDGKLARSGRLAAGARRIVEQLAPGSKDLALLLNLAGRIENRQGNGAQAAELFSRAIETLEGQIVKLGDFHDLNASYRARHRDLYRDAIRLALDRGRAEEAFHFLERSRARGFLALLAEKDLVFGNEVPPELERLKRQNAARIDQAQARLAGLSLDPAGDLETVAELQGELHRLQRERREILAEHRRVAPAVAALRQPRPLDLAATRAMLDEGTVMLSFSVGHRRTDVFVVSRDGGLRTFEVGLGEDSLRQWVLELQAAIEDEGAGARDASRTSAKKLFEALIAPAEGWISGAERLLLIPDGPLHRLPFAALVRPLEEAKQTWQYLVEWKPLHSALSATVYAELRQRGLPERDGKAPQPDARTAPGPFVAFGDPTYPRRRGTEHIAVPRLRSVIEQGLFEWSSLPASRREVERIGALYPRSRIYLGERASEEQAKQLDSSARLLHFATHGYLDDRLPLNSALVLSIPESYSAGQENGLLQVWEIFEHLRLDADLVVLSACRTALGRELDGEGMIGLTRAFQHAGARTVGASLWNVSDTLTAELMARFYGHLSRGAGKDESLRAAQLELLRGPIDITSKSGHPIPMDASLPYFWAAFQLIGDWR